MSKLLFKIDDHREVWLEEINPGDEQVVMKNDGRWTSGYTLEQMDAIARQWLAHSAIHDGYTKSELEAAFKKVQNADHWKNPIDAIVRVKDVDITAKAIEFFTATSARFFKTETPGHMRVTAKGYRAGPAGDN